MTNLLFFEFGLYWFLSDTHRIRIRGYFRNNILCIGTDASEPEEALTYCFAIVCWHLVGKIEVGVTLSICTRNHSGTEPALSVFSHGLLLYYYRRTFRPA